jgi:hypothetical protein
MLSLSERLTAQLAARLPLHFRVLFRQFLLRVIDLEALSIEADIPRFLGQFAGILIMFSLLQLMGALMFPPPPDHAWQVEQSRISAMLLVVGLVAVTTWDATFPDRRDVMVLGALPLPARTILAAKVAASASLLGLAVVALSCASSLGYSVVFGMPHGGTPGMARFFVSYWITMAACAAFLYGAVLTVQGFTALTLPRNLFLRVSAILQLAAFGAFLSVYFLQPSLDTQAQLLDPANRRLLAWSPTLWFFALFNQLNGTLPAPLAWVAHRAWIALGAVFVGGAAALLLAYVRIMKKTVEAPDLVPGPRGSVWRLPRFGGVRAAIVTFCIRSLTRSRQHRVAFAFFLSIVFAIGLDLLRDELSATTPVPITSGFLIATFMMMSFAVLGLRATFSLPIALNANWVLRITQLRGTEKYFAATRLCLLLFAVVPTLVLTAALSLRFRPWRDVGAHLILLALLGCLFVELGLFRFDKVPFTCSYLPGKSNVQVVFWGFVLIWIALGSATGVYEYGALHNGAKFAIMTAWLLVMTGVLSAYNRVRAQSAELYFEDLPPEVVTRLGLVYVPPPETAAPVVSADRSA